MFFSTACRYLKGQSGLPSALPARGSVDLAKENSRKVRLFCKGLEQFREILYKEPVDESIASVAAVEELNLPGLTSAVTGVIADEEAIISAIEQDQNAPGATDAVTEMAVNQGSTASADVMQTQGPTDSTDAATETVADQEPQNKVSIKRQLIFQSLFEAKETPPGSPRSVSSSSTLVNPQSRKVSPTAVKDFAYPSSDSNHVLDPVALIEEKTKKELLKLLQKKTAAEEKASRKVAKLRARNKALSAELEAAKGKVQSRDAQGDLVKTQANAMTLSNVVLRQVVQDLCHELSRERNVARIQGTRSQGESVSFVEKYGLDPAVLSDIVNSVTTTVQKEYEKKDTEEGSHSEEVLDGVKEHEAGSVANEADLATLQDSQQLEEETEEEETEEEETEEEETEEEETEEEQKEEEQTEEEQTGKGSCPAEATADEVKANVEWIFPGLKPKESTAGKGQTTADPIAAVPEDALPDHDSMSESSGEDQVFEVDYNNSPSTIDDLISGSDCDEDPATQEPTTDAIPTHDSVQAADSGREGGTYATYEFSEAAGPATLWNILQSNQCENEAQDEADAGEEAAGEEIAGEDAVGVLESDQVEDEAIPGEEAAGVPEAEVPGPATLWGLLESNQVRDEAVAGEQAAGVSEVEAPGPATLWGLLESNQVKDEVVAGERAADVSDGDSSDEESGEQAEAKGSLVLDESGSNGLAGVQDQGGAEFIGLSHDGYSPDVNEDHSDLYDVSDDEEEIMEPPTNTTAPTIEEDPAPSPHGSVDGDNVATQEVHTEEVTVEEAVAIVGADSLNAVQAVTEPIGDSNFVGEDDQEAQNGASGAVETVHLTESVLSVGTNTLVGAMEDMNESAGDATVAREEDREEQQAAQGANVSEAHVASEQLEDNCEKECVDLAGDDAIMQTNSFQNAPAEQKQGLEKGDTLEGPVVFGGVKIACEDISDHVDHELHSVAVGDPSINTAEVGHTNSGVDHAQSLTVSGTPSELARASSLPEPEAFDFVLPMITPKELTKNEKRKLERRRAAAKKQEEARERRLMEAEAAKTPEALAQRQAEEDARLGNKRLKLQAARMQEQFEKVVSGRK